MTVCGGEFSALFGTTVASCTHDCPSVCCVCTSVPEEHPSMAAAFEHREFHEMPPSTKTPVGLTITPTMQPIIIDGVAIVDPQLTAIVGYDAETVGARPEDSQAASPTHSEVIASGETRPSATCVAIVDSVPPTSHVRPAPIQVLATATLTKVVGVLPEETMAISGAMVSTSAACPDNSPPVSSIRTMVPEEHPS